jgi:hypothetical protein
MSSAGVSGGTVVYMINDLWQKHSLSFIAPLSQPTWMPAETVFATFRAPRVSILLREIGVTALQLMPFSSVNRNCPWRQNSSQLFR